MTLPDHRIQLVIYKTMVDQNKFQLVEMLSRYDAMAINLPEAMDSESSALMDDYIKQLRSMLNTCEAIRKVIDERLTELG
jgi:hypothetical protein